jgi:hypothetical protein
MRQNWLRPGGETEEARVQEYLSLSDKPQYALTQPFRLVYTHQVAGIGH